MKIARLEVDSVIVLCPECAAFIRGPRLKGVAWKQADALRAVKADRVHCPACGEDSKLPAVLKKLGEIS